MAADVVGQWEPLFDLQNVAIHAHLLPDGKVLYWGRRTQPGATEPATLNEHLTNSFVWDPLTGNSEPTATHPQLFGGGGVNLFCSGHSVQPDGSLFVVGGHLFDGQGVNQACVYDPVAKTWSAKQPMNDGRWYPSALTLSDGSILSISGSYRDIATSSNVTNNNPQIWRNNAWTSVQSPPNNVLFLFPRLHLDPKGRVFMAGPQAQSQFLDVNGDGTWTTNGPMREAAARDYAPSVMYDSGKIIYIGGGNDPGTRLPAKMAEIIDLNDANPQWSQTQDMHFRRRQHNGTVLPDGTVLVTGGTQGVDFNDLDPNMPVHDAELWDPNTQTWALMAKESADRCYHSTALLLPDGRVLSAGGGEYSPANDGKPNNPKDSLKNAQLFKPTYLFKGSQPIISNAPNEIVYGQKFDITLGGNVTIEKVSWVRLGSVTHSCNMNQRLVFLTFQQQDLKVTVQAPSSVNIAPPGHYMLFVLNQQGVPSVAPIIHIAQSAPTTKPAALLVQRTATAESTEVSLPALNEKIINEETKAAVVVGLTPSCPYGLGACWGGAFDALQRISDIEVVRPVPNQIDSVAYVYLRQDILPDIDVWRSEFEKTANGAYIMRGIELTLSGEVIKKQVGTEEQLMLAGTTTRPELVLAPLQATNKLEWDMKRQAPKDMSEEEADAYTRLSREVAARSTGATVQVTGPLKKLGANNFSLDVRKFKTGEVDNITKTSG